MPDKSMWIKKFKELHRSKTGEELSDSVAMQLFERLIAFVENIYGNK